MSTNSRKETLRLLDENIRESVSAGAKIPTKLEHEWRNVPDLIRRLLTAIPPDKVDLIRELQEYSNMICTLAPFVVKAGYTRDMPLQTMRMHIMSIMESYHVPITNTRPWTIQTLWHRPVVEIFHSLRYDSTQINSPYVCSSPCIDDA
jgi:hypothetical protein